MHSIIRKVPIPICGVALAIASLGLLLERFGVWISVTCGFLSVLVLALFAAKVVLFSQDIAGDMKNVVLAGVSGTLPMACAVLSGYLATVSGVAQIALWCVAFIAHWSLIVYFSIRFVPRLKLENLTPAWFVAYIGVAVFCLNWPLAGIQWLKWATMLFATFACIILMVAVTVRFVQKGDLPVPMRPLICIYAAPFSMCLAAYLAIADECIVGVGFVLWGVGVVCYLVGLINALRCLRQPFSPPYAAMTFPFVISASATTKFAATLAMMSPAMGAYLDLVAAVQTVIAVVMTMYVLARYLMFLFGDDISPKRR